jgi:hypothetical protein
MLEALSPYISSETEQWTRVLAQGILRNSTVLEGIGAVEKGSVVLTLEGPAGTRTEKIFFSSWQTKQIPIWDALGYPVFLARSNSPEEYYWHAFLEDSKTLYIQYNRCAADPKLPFADFTSSVLKDIDEHRPHRVVVDLRFNTGGNSRVIQPLIQGLSARRKVIGVPYALIGPITFSSGIMAANDLRNKAKAKLVGSPTGGLLGGYGEAPERRLPNSGVNVQWTIKKFNSGRQIKPDIKAEMRLEDVLVGRDAVLEAALTAP